MKFLMVLISWSLSIGVVHAQNVPESQIRKSYVDPLGVEIQGGMIATYIERLKKEFDYDGKQPVVLISVKEQELYHITQEKLISRYTISTAAKGIGSESGSNKTPEGIHVVKEKFGDGAKEGAIFVARANTGKVAKVYTDNTDVEKDDVTTRILWLDGQEKGVNKGKGIDSYSRYIYIHGTPEEGLLGQPASKGCIRMKNSEVIELYNKVPVGTFVVIMNDLDN